MSSSRFTHPRIPLSRRTAITGLGAGGAVIAASRLGVAAQDAAPGAMANGAMAHHPIVGLWQYTDTLGEAPDLFLEMFHADGTYLTGGGPEPGVAFGIWRTTGDTSGEVVIISLDINPTETLEAGTTTFRSTLQVDETGRTLTYSDSTIDVRDAFGILLFADSFDFPPSTRVTFDANPATGSTMVGTPEAGTPTS